MSSGTAPLTLPSWSVISRKQVSYTLAYQVRCNEMASDAATPPGPVSSQQEKEMELNVQV